MNPSSPIDVVYERQWASLRQLSVALLSRGLLNNLYGGFPAFRYRRGGIPSRHLRTFPLAAVFNLFADRLHLAPRLRLNEPRWVGNWVARSKHLAPIVIANGTAHRYLFPKLKAKRHVLVLMRGSSHPKKFYECQQVARRESGLPFRNELPPEVVDEIQKNQYVDLLLAGSEMIRDNYIAEGFPPERAFACAYGIDEGFYSFRKRVPATNRAIRIGIVGVVGLRKGLSRSLHVLDWAERRGHAVELHLVGPVLDSESTQMLHASGHRAIHHGVIKGKELVNLYHYFDMAMLPSYEDGFGQSVIEAMSTGLPVVVSESVGAKEAIASGRNGLVLTSFSDQELDAKLAPFITDKEGLVSMGCEARAAIEANFTLVHYNRRFQSFLDAAFDLAKSRGLLAT
jgi:glycosyltransferase involved in cell wall biosynthesis